MESDSPAAGNSREVTSNQPHLHPKLAQTVHRHLASSFRAVEREHNLRAYESLQARIGESNSELILDSFCGTGLSTQQIARRFPKAIVVGIDKSDNRLLKQAESAEENCFMLRAECEAIWRMLARDGIKLFRHYLLYPNPWPKSRHLKRRIHGHPCFGQLLALGGKLELRSNWQIYVEEFGAAMHIAHTPGVISRIPTDEPPMTLFEKKYRDSGHKLWLYRCNLDEYRQGE